MRFQLVKLAIALGVFLASSVIVAIKGALLVVRMAGYLLLLGLAYMLVRHVAFHALPSIW